MLLWSFRPPLHEGIAVLIVLVIAIVLLMGCVVLSAIVPHPITWLMTAILALGIGLVIWPKYQAEKAVQKAGVDIQATVSDVREWARKIGDGQLRTQYEVTATWTHPDTGKTHTFISVPYLKRPAVTVGDTVKVSVVWDAPEQYQMQDLNGSKP